MGEDMGTVPLSFFEDMGTADCVKTLTDLI